MHSTVNNISESHASQKVEPFKMQEGRGKWSYEDREIDFDEADVGAGEAAGWSRAWFGHPGEDARLAVDW
jgi:hypothetical protein